MDQQKFKVNSLRYEYISNVNIKSKNSTKNVTEKAPHFSGDSMYEC